MYFVLCIISIITNIHGIVLHAKSGKKSIYQIFNIFNILYLTKKQSNTYIKTKKLKNLTSDLGLVPFRIARTNDLNFLPNNLLAKTKLIEKYERDLNWF